MIIHMLLSASSFPHRSLPVQDLIYETERSTQDCCHTSLQKTYCFLSCCKHPHSIHLLCERETNRDQSHLRGESFYLKDLKDLNRFRGHLHNTENFMLFGRSFTQQRCFGDLKSKLFKSSFKVHVFGSDSVIIFLYTTKT